MKLLRLLAIVMWLSAIFVVTARGNCCMSGDSTFYLEGSENGGLGGLGVVRHHRRPTSSLLNLTLTGAGPGI
jgi:hypothetical protein